MVFSSLTFLYCFLPLTVLLYFAVPAIAEKVRPLLPFGTKGLRSRMSQNTEFTLKWHNGVLLAASLIFYAWGEPKLVLMMLLATAIAYFGGLGMDCFNAASKNDAAASNQDSASNDSEIVVEKTDSKKLVKNCFDHSKKNREKNTDGKIEAFNVKSFRVLFLEKIKITKKQIFAVTVALLVANLFVFKYFNFAVSNFAQLFGLSANVAEIALPIGISFYTFQILSYVIDLYRGEISVQKNFACLLLYVCLFPQLIAGPIVRYRTVEQELSLRHETWDDAFAGAVRFIAGLGKKVLLANNLAIIAETIYAGEASIAASTASTAASIAATGAAVSATSAVVSGTAFFGAGAYWVAAIAYTLQIYFDFSGYSDMAIGIGRIFGFNFEENFNRPYLATSVTDFWRRWHISLSGWFRDYVYIPLGGNRVGPIRRILNILIVWALTGLWHGAQWNFVLWGLYYGVLLIIEKAIRAWWKSGAEKRVVNAIAHRSKSLKETYRKLDIANTIWDVLVWMLTMLIVIIGWVLFNRSGQVAETGQIAANVSQTLAGASGTAGAVSSNVSQTLAGASAVSAGQSQIVQTLSVMFSSAPTRWMDAIRANTELLYGLIWIPAAVLTVIFEKGGLGKICHACAKALGKICHVCAKGSQNTESNTLDCKDNANHASTNELEKNESLSKKILRKVCNLLVKLRAHLTDMESKPVLPLLRDFFTILWSLAVLALCLMQLLNSSYNPFIYFRF